MILTAIFLVPLILSVDLGLALDCQPPSDAIDQLDECSAMTSTTTSAAEATIEIGSENLNISSVIKFVTVTAFPACLTAQRSWNTSVAFPDLQSLPISGSNQTFNGSKSSPTLRQPIVTAPPSTASGPSTSSPLIFDHSSAPQVRPTAIASTPIFTGSGRRPFVSIYDPLVVFLAGAIHFGLA